MVEQEDVAALVCALLANDAVTGQTVSIDGGMVMDEAPRSWR